MENTYLLRCGFGRKEITPPLGTPIVGYYKPRFVKGVIDPLYARAAVFEKGGEKCLVLTMDLCLLTKEKCTAIREIIAENTGLHPDAVFITLSHTHTGPLTGKDFASDTVIDPAYITYLNAQALAAAEEAFSDLAPAKLFYAKTEAKGISFIRRYRMKDGSTKTNPKVMDPNIDHPWGEPNEELRLLKIEREGAEDLYLVNFGTHADTVGGEYITADWPGFVCSILEGAIPGSRAMFLLGPQGDVNHCNRFVPNAGKIGKGKDENPTPEETTAHARYMGRVIAGQILTVCDKAEEIPADEIRFGTLDLALPTNRDCERIEEALKVYDAYVEAYQNNTGTAGGKIPGSKMTVPEARRIIRMQNEPDFYHYSVFGIRIGGFAFAGLPGEPFTEIGRSIYKDSPFENMMICALTGASCGYVGTGKAYEEGGYETLTSSYKKGADKVMIDGMLELLNQIK